MDTNIKIKKKYYPIWCKKVWERLIKGKEKYKLKNNSSREVTDIADELIPNFNLGDIIKYIGEYLNTGDSKDLYDISGMAYIRWLKDLDKKKNK